MDPTTWQGLQVLIVEPEERLAEPLAEALRLLGAHVACVRDGRSALAHLRGHSNDAVVLATPLPDNVWTTLAAWILQQPAAPVLLILAADQDSAVVAGGWPHGRGPDAVLERQAKPEEVCRALEQAWSFQTSESTSDASTSSLPALLVDLRERTATGVLEIRAEGVCTRIFIRGGAPVLAEGGALRETLGRMLLQRGALTDAEYLRVIDRMTERLMESETTRMGEVLVELGMLTPAEVFTALSEQVREKILGCFHWERFAHGFEPADSMPEELSAYPGLALEPLILAGLRAHYGLDRLEPILAPFADRRPALAGDLARLITRFQFSPVEQRVLGLVDRERTLAMVRSVAPIDPLHAAQLLAALVLAKGLAWCDDPGVRRRTLRAEPRAHAKAAPEGASPSPAPAASVPSPGTAPDPAPTSPPLRPAVPPRSLAMLRSTLARAGKEVPVALDPKAAALEAERAFRKGLLCLEHSAPAGALRAFGRACALRGDEPEYKMYEAWAALLVAPDDEARAVARVKAATCARAMLKRNRDSAHAHRMLGQIQLAAGDLDDAERHFRGLLRVTPEDHEAQRGLRTIERRRAAR